MQPVECQLFVGLEASWKILFKARRQALQQVYGIEILISPI